MSATCTNQAYSCLCTQDIGHEGPHTCECGGSWNGQAGADSFEVVAFPARGSNITSILYSSLLFPGILGGAQ